MSRNERYRPPPGWVSTGWLEYTNEKTGAVVMRDTDLNPETGLIEWVVLLVEGDPVYTGQNLHDAFAIGSEE